MTARRSWRAVANGIVLTWLLVLPLRAAPPGELCLADGSGLRVADARLLDGLGPYRAPPVSKNAEAQRYFEQGMVVGWGFNFAEAVRSFRAAVARDPDCAACRWGIAWALGPSINHEVVAADLPAIRDALLQARVYASDARTRALVESLSLRFPAQGTTLAAADEQRYADAMVALAGRYPADADIAILAAEALLTAHSYDWWRSDGAPQPWTPQILGLLERALALAPDHVGAHHYRIHLYDESPTPQRAVESAQRLPQLAPGVGHLVHMPSHTWLRLGRYHDAVLANRDAIAADERYAAATRADAAYIAGYALHNRHFLWTAALWSGESQAARAAAELLATTAARWPGEDLTAGTRQHLQAAPWLTEVRFGRWDEILARQRDAQEGVYLRGIAAYAQGTARARRGDVAGAQRELRAVKGAQRQVRAEALKIKGINSADDLLAVAADLLQADIAAARGDRAAAVRAARRAVTREDKLGADEPPVWPIPARHRLGAALLAAGQPAQAAAVYRDDLKEHPANAPALLGLAAARQQLGQTTDAERLRAEAAAAWRYADVPLP
jgi:hypothetical protein